MPVAAARHERTLTRAQRSDVGFSALAPTADRALAPGPPTQAYANGTERSAHEQRRLPGRDQSSIGAMLGSALAIALW